MSRFYVTTAIDYVNSRPHLGTAYEKITTDVIARYKRLSGVETRFVMGNDEHSHNVFQRARDEGLEPLVFCDQMEQVFRDVWNRLDISFDDFIRTTEERHRCAVTKFIQRIAAAGDLYEGSYEGWYCVSCEAFKQEKDLVDELCPIHQKRPEWIKEKNHFFRLSRYQETLLTHYAQHPKFLQPESRRNEVLRFLEAGPEDISMSRTGQAWGIPLPNDRENVVYVWADALINYISAVGYGTNDDVFQKWWPADLHVIGKDITRFHCVIWPAMLLSAGLPLPRQIFGHGWVHWKGQKMSKSLGTAVDPLDAADRLGPDPLRLYLTKEIAYGRDGDFSWERFEDRYNTDLANNFGNLVSRLSSMAHRYRSGMIRSVGTPGPLAKRTAEVVSAYKESMDALALQEGAAAAFELIDATNEYIADVQPWAVAKDDSRSAELDQQLFDIAEAIRISAVLLLPVMPTSAAEVLRRVGDERDPNTLRFDLDTNWSGGERVISKGDPLWPRLERKKKDTSMDQPDSELGSESPAASEDPETSNESEGEELPTTSLISIDYFAKLDLRVGRITAAEAVPKSRKLIRIQLDTGNGQRQVLAGILGTYEPEALVGKTVIFVANLKPAKLAGLESNGMLLAASLGQGPPVLLSVEDVEAAPPGSKVN